MKETAWAPVRRSADKRRACQWEALTLALLMDRLNEVRRSALCGGHGAATGFGIRQGRARRAAPADGEFTELSEYAARGIRYQVAYNTLASFGRGSTPSLARSRIGSRRHYTALGSESPAGFAPEGAACTGFFTATRFPSALNWSVLFRWQ